MTINEIISYIQNVYNKGPKTDETELSDRFVYELVKKIRAKLIKQTADKFNKIPDAYYQSIDCFPLEVTQLIDCGCIDTGCRVLKSKYKVPLFVTGRNKSLFNVYNVFGDSISPTSLESRNYNKYSKTKKGKSGWFLHNGYLVVIDENNTTEMIIIKGVFEDPLELQGLSTCDGVICQDPYKTDFPIEGAMFDTLTKMCYEEIIKYMKVMPIDLDNNSAPVINQPN
jgi:hypothetical protein